MEKLLDPNGLFARIMNTLLTLAVLNLCFLLCCLPIVTVGASASALSAVLLRLREGLDDRPVRRFFAAFRENFKCATAAWLVLLLALAVCGIDLWLAGRAGSDVARVLALAGMMFVAMTATFLFPLVARFENKWYNHLKNAALLVLGHLPRLLLGWLPWAAAVVLTFYSFETMYSMILLWILAGFSSLGYATLWALAPVLRSLEPKEESEE